MALSRSSILIALLGLLCLADIASAKPGKHHVRVRKEFRNLTPKEYKLYLTGLATMYSVDITVGQQIFGPKYRDYEYFIIKHAIVTQTPVDGGIYDLGHFGPWFMTFHQAFCMEFENSLLSIVPELKAMPYWNIALDLKGTPQDPGRYYNTSQWFFSEKYIGQMDGNPNNGYVADTSFYGGVFAGINIKKFNTNKWKSLEPLFNGSLTTGLLRDPHNTNTTPYLIRYPAANLAQIPSRAYMAAGLEMNYTEKDLARCTQPSVVKDAFDFVMCVDTFATVVLGVSTQPEIITKWVDNISSFSHIIFHNILGSFLNGTEAQFPPFGYLGDSRVVNTSPNEILGFFPYHSNLVRAFMIYQEKSVKANQTLGDDNVLWNYPQKVSTTPDPYIVFPGATIDDPIAPANPFTDILSYPTPQGVTHREILQYNHRKYYTYDNMIS